MTAPTPVIFELSRQSRSGFSRNFSKDFGISFRSACHLIDISGDRLSSNTVHQSIR